MKYPIVLTALCLSSVSIAQVNGLSKCMQDQLATASDDMTVGQLRAACMYADSNGELANGPVQPDEPELEMTPLQKRFAAEFDVMERQFAITTHQPNYILGTYNSKTNQEFAQEIVGEDAFDDEEVKWQVSAKFPLARDFIRPGNDVFFGFTTTSWWQLLNGDYSEPIRETNYEPELFWRHYGGPKLLNGQVPGFDLALVHESNGRGLDDASRSWNRVMFRSALDYGEVAFALRTWYRIPEDDDEDDNPKMHRYYGYGDLTTMWAPNRNTFTAMLRPGTDKNAVEFTWSYPITRILRVYAQYYNGYGENLLDYDKRTQRIGLGVALNDLIQRD